MSKSGPIPLFPCHSIEDFPTHLSGSEAAGVLAAWTVTWHPEWIAASGQTPKWSSTDFLSENLEDRQLLIPSVSRQRLCSDIEKLIENGKCQPVYNLESREDYLNCPELRQWLSSDLDRDVPQEFFALAYGYLQVQLMTRQIRYSSGLDDQEFETRLVQAARGALEKTSDLKPLLQSCYDLLLEERNRFYPSQPELLDLVMMAPTTLGNRCEKQLESTHKMNLLFTGQLVKTVKEKKPGVFQMVQSALADQRAEIVGGVQTELPQKLMGVESQLNQIDRGIAEIQADFGQRPTLFVRRTFGLNPKLPGDLQQFDFAGALHANLGRGSIPDASSTMINWEATDGATISAIHQKPRDAADAGSFLGLGKFIGEALDSVHQSTVVFAHWPDRTCDAFLDLLCGCKYGPLLGEFVTASECFDGFHDPGYSERFTDDEYRSRTLIDWVKGEIPNPISRVTGYWRNYYLLQSLYGLRTMASFFRSVEGDSVGSRSLEQLSEARNRNDLCLHESQKEQPEFSELADGVNSDVTAQLRIEQVPENGASVVIINPLSFSRRVHVRLPQVFAGSMKSEPPIVLADSGDSGSDLVVDVPAMGSVVIDPSGRSGDPLKKDPPVLDGLALRNEYFEVLVDEKTGGILSLNRHRKRGNLLTQRLSMRKSGGGYASMVADSIETEQSSRIHAEVKSSGRIVFDEEIVGTFEQSVSVTRGCPDIRIKFKISPQNDLSGKPWENYFCSRWAWHDEAAEIRRESLGSRFFLMEEKFEAPNLIDIESEQAKISLLTMGNPFHRRSARRILDTLLAVRGETNQESEMAIAVNVEMSTHKAIELSSPVLVGYAHQGDFSGGWFFHISSKNLVATTSLPRFDSDGKVVGAMFRFQETEGRNGRLKLTCPRAVGSAKRVNFLGEYLGDADIDDRTVAVDFGPNQHFQLELNWRT